MVNRWVGVGLAWVREVKTKNEKHADRTVLDVYAEIPLEYCLYRG